MATKWGAKTAIGDAAAQESWNKNWMKNESKKATSDRVRQARDEADAEVKRETRGVEEPMTSGQKQSMQEAKDAAMQSKKDKAYNAAKTYPDDYAKGGMTASRRADGIAQRGKTRGKMI
jgi:predicted  nucleic acid-binding Zn-ribbon protein